jgi:phosphatidylserine/phosphatidylglycerophosphate/cardiolipin synthase-like enzyme
VHVKCAIADEKVALVTSANLTGAAMEDNMELGLMVSNRHAVGRISAHFSALITENVIKKV